jgi:hypothetical protein
MLYHTNEQKPLPHKAVTSDGFDFTLNHAQDHPERNEPEHVTQRKPLPLMPLRLQETCVYQHAEPGIPFGILTIKTVTRHESPAP